MSAEDLGTIVSTGAEALGGRGEDLNRLLGDLTTVVTDLDGQRLEIARTIDGFAHSAPTWPDGDDEVVHPDRRPVRRLGDPGPEPAAHDRRPPRASGT